MNTHQVPNPYHAGIIPMATTMFYINKTYLCGLNVGLNALAWLQHRYFFTRLSVANCINPDDKSSYGSSLIWVYTDCRSGFSCARHDKGLDHWKHLRMHICIQWQLGLFMTLQFKLLYWCKCNCVREWQLALLFNSDSLQQILLTSLLQIQNVYFLNF